MITGNDLVLQARLYLGVVYYHCGRDRNGLDCSGLVLRVAHDLGLTDWDEVDYSEQVNPEYMKSNLLRFCEEQPISNEPQAGDILWLAPGNHPQHVAFYCGDGLMIHSHQGPGKVVETGYDLKWRKRLRGVFRWRGLTRKEEG